MRHRTAYLACLLAVLPMPALAEAAGASEVDAIIVTARRRVEDVQTVPAAISVVNGDTLARTYSVNLNQVTQLVPTLNYSSPNPRNTAFTIRGLGSSVVAISQANDGLEPGVGFYVDQVYHARPATAAFDFTDLEQVEVLRGPQGTVFGKNTTAGAINITTKSPSFAPATEAEISGGQLGFVQAKATMTGPLVTDLLAFRLSGALTRRDGVLTHVTTGAKLNDLHNDALRAQLSLTPNTAFSLRLIADWSNYDNRCCTQVFVRVAPTLKPTAQQYAALAAGQGYAPPSINPYDRRTNIDARLAVDTQEGGVTSIAQWQGPTTTLTSVSAWRFWDWDAANDRDYTGLQIQTTQHIPSRQDQYSQEVRLSSREPGKLEYVAGLYYFHQKIVGHPISIYGPMAAYWLLPAGRPANLLEGYQTDGTTDFSTSSYALFGEVTWHPTPRLALTGGARYTYEKKDGSYDVRAFGGLATTTPSLINDKTSILRSQSYAAHLSDGSASGRVNIAYDLTDNVMAYAGYARGQKSGGINMSGLPVYPSGVAGHAAGDPILDTVTVRPEQNTTLEIGLKSQTADRALTFNINGFHTTVRDFQANVVDNAAVIALRSYLANIPRVRVRGVELDGAARLNDHLTMRFAGAFSDGQYASYANGPCPIELTGTATAKCDLTGKALPGLPRWSGTVGGEYVAQVSTAGFDGQIYLRADANAKTKIFGDATGSTYTVIKGYTLVNASIGLRARQGWEIALFARNLFDTNYLQNLTVQAGNSGLIVGTPSDPRIIGVTLRMVR